MNNSLKRQLTRTFTKMLSDLKNPEEIEKFFTDFFDDSEFEKYVRRMAVIYWLKKGRDEENIKTNLGVSKSEILNAGRLLKKSGVKLALKYIEAEEWANEWAEKIRRFAKK